METDKLIAEQFNRLPQSLQTAINTVPWKSRVNEISLLKTLSLEQVDTVKRETMFIIYGFENPEDYVANLMREAEIDEDTANAIAEVVDETIFKEISQIVENEEKGNIISSSETKSEAMQRLSERMGTSTTQTPAAIHNNLPMIEEGEVAHEVPHVESPVPTAASSAPQALEVKPIQTPKTPHYPTGKDPYREPIE